MVEGVDITTARRIGFVARQTYRGHVRLALGATETAAYLRLLRKIRIVAERDGLAEIPGKSLAH